MRRIDPSALEAQAAADRDRGGAITVTQCRERYALTDDDIAALAPPRIGWAGPVYRVEVVLQLLERPEREARTAQLGTPAAVPEGVTTVAARGAA